MDNSYTLIIFVLVLLCITVLGQYKSYETFSGSKKFNWGRCKEPKEWVEKKCKNTSKWMKGKKGNKGRWSIQKRCPLKCGLPSKGPSCPPCKQNQTTCPPCDDDTPVSVTPIYPTLPPLIPIKDTRSLALVDDKHKQSAEFIFDSEFGTPTLDFNDTYNKVELHGDGTAQVCRKNYNELCDGSTRPCNTTKTDQHCVVLDKTKRTYDFNDERKDFKDDVSAVKIIGGNDETRVRLLSPKYRKDKKMPAELTVRNADKLAWNDAISQMQFDDDKYKLALWEKDKWEGKKIDDVQSGRLPDMSRKGSSFQFTDRT